MTRHGTSSKPVTATSPGTLTPRRASAWMTPSAVWSFAHTIARGNSPPGRERSDHLRATCRAVVPLPPGAGWIRAPTAVAAASKTRARARLSGLSACPARYAR